MADRFIELNALSASTSRRASVSSSSNVFLVAWIAASIPHGVPQHVCNRPPDFFVSALSKVARHLPEILRIISPIPIGRT